MRVYCSGAWEKPEYGINGASAAYEQQEVGKWLSPFCSFYWDLLC